MYINVLHSYLFNERHLADFGQTCLTNQNVFLCYPFSYLLENTLLLTCLTRSERAWSMVDMLRQNEDNIAKAGKC